jgi:hypothetical protein
MLPPGSPLSPLNSNAWQAERIAIRVKNTVADPVKRRLLMEAELETARVSGNRQLAEAIVIIIGEEF